VSHRTQGRAIARRVLAVVARWTINPVSSCGKPVSRESTQVTRQGQFCPMMVIKRASNMPGAEHHTGSLPRCPSSSTLTLAAAAPGPDWAPSEKISHMRLEAPAASCSRARRSPGIEMPTTKWFGNCGSPGDQPSCSKAPRGTEPADAEW